jgi:hypothetical protein
MLRKFFFLIVCAFLLSIIPTSAFAEMTFKWGGAERIRHEYWKNMSDVNNDRQDTRNFFRVKSSIWGQADVNENLGFFGKLTNEFKAYTFFEGASGSVPDKSASKKGYHFDMNEIVFDNLYADIKNIFELPVDLRLGRQDFLGTYGEGFLIMDGTPQDGSRTFYFNAAKASWRVNEKNTLDFIYINNPRDEEFLPVINRLELTKASDPTHDDIPQLLNTTDEQGYVLYLKNKDIENLGLEAYYIFKKEDAEGGTKIQSKESYINTLGSFAKYDLNSWTFRGQLAGQFGDDGDEDRSAMGGYGFVDKNFKDKKWSPKASLGYLYLSGDDPSTDKNEAWNPLFSRYPWMSELYVISIASDTNVGIAGYWTNVSIVRAELSAKPTGKSKISLYYNYLRANENVTSSPVCSGTGKERGHLPQIKFDYAFNKNISTYFLAEYLIPGDFYVDRDPAVFLRTELLIKF